MPLQSFEMKSQTFNMYLAFLVNALKTKGSYYIGFIPQVELQKPLGSNE